MAITPCPKCNQNISDEAEQCVYCGYVLKKCPQCNKMLSENLAFCPYCGAPITCTHAQSDVITSDDNQEESAHANPQKKKKIITSLLVAAVVIIGLGVYFFHFKPYYDTLALIDEAYDYYSEAFSYYSEAESTTSAEIRQSCNKLGDVNMQMAKIKVHKYEEIIPKLTKAQQEQIEVYIAKQLQRAVLNW